MASVHTIPLLFLNLGGEMLYILDQRLCAQRISKDKAYKDRGTQHNDTETRSKASRAKQGKGCYIKHHATSKYATVCLYLQPVMNDIVGIMLNEKFLRELFKPQQVYNKVALRQLFEDLAHASIMRLNGESMNKLYDLMTMVFKYQLVMCSEPSDVILITLNHLDAIRDFVSSPLLHKQIDSAYNLLMITYAAMTSGELQRVRFSLLNFLQDIHVRVSVFLKDGSQTNEGRFVIPVNRVIPPGGEVPGFVRYFDSTGEISNTEYFNPGGICTRAEGRGSMEMYGDRGTHLGSNIYKTTPRSSLNYYDQAFCPDDMRAAPVGRSLATEDQADELRVGKEELNLLMTQLLRNEKHGEVTQLEKDVIYLHLFNADVDEEEINQPNTSGDVLNVDVRYQGCSDALQKVYGEMTITSSVEDHRDDCTDEEDLLDLLDDV